MTNQKIAAAVAIALGTGGIAHATAPTLAQCQSPAEQVYVAGSSAAQKAFFAGVNADILGSNGALYVSDNGNFQAICGVSANSAVAPIGTSLLIHYRAEGGSVVGALPIAASGSHPLNFLLTSGAASVGTLAAPVTLAVTGTSSTVGTTDGWGGTNLVKHLVDIGITDLEAGQLVGQNYPTAYSPSVFGSASATQMGNLKSKSTPLVDQVFALYVNTTNIGNNTSGQAINLSRETVANILDGTITDWAQVPTVTGGQVNTNGSASPITVINREAGSGSRTGASIYFLDYNCAQTSRFINDPSPANDYYATGDAINAATSTPGGITYASIDNAGKANLTQATLSGIKASNLTATSGDYDWWYEAQVIKGNTSLDSVGTAFYTYVSGTIPEVSKAPQVADILAIPGAGTVANTTSVPVTATGIIYVNPYGRNSNSCGQPKKK